MLEHVPCEQITSAHLAWLAASLLSAPLDNRPTAEDLTRAIWLGTMRLFEWDGGCVLVGQSQNRLVVHAFGCDKLVGIPAPLTADLKKLAADWQCDTIETTCFDTRLASVIQRLGGRVESQTLTLAVE